MSSNEDRVQGAPPTQNAPIGEVVNGAPKDDGEPAKSQESSAQPKLSVMSKLKGLWAKTGIDLPIFKIMVKGALSPTIAIASYQASDFADLFTTVGYLVGIMAILSTVIMPRAKFIQTMLINVLVTCAACALALLAMYTVVRARINTEAVTRPGTGGPGTSGTPAPGAQTAGYNSSAAAVAGIWLFFQIYLLACWRARMPQMTIPSILWAIFANVSMVYAPQFSTMVQATAFAKKLLTAFLTGFAIGSGVSLFVFPSTSRKIVFKEMAGYLTSLRAAMKANAAYMHSLEESDMFTAMRTNTDGEKPPRSPEAEAFKGKMRALAALHAKLHADLAFAKREVAFGKLGPDSLQQIFRQLRNVMVPLLGLSSLSDIYERITEERGWDKPHDDAPMSPSQANDPDEKFRLQSVRDWHDIMQILRAPFRSITQTVDEGLEHILIVLQLAPRPKKGFKGDDVESKGSQPGPGHKDFAMSLDQRIQAFDKEKRDVLRRWCFMHDMDLPEDFFEQPKSAEYSSPKWLSEDQASPQRGAYRRQLYLSLYMEFLLGSVSRAVYDLVLYADLLEGSGKLSKTRLIVPGVKRLRKWAKSVFTRTEDATQEDQHGMDDVGGSTSTVYLGEAYKQKKDPEHLPPQSAFERFGDQLRGISHFLASPASAFGFRAACATMSCAIIAYLHDTQTFYTTQRLFWSQIMISIGMSPSAGQSLRSFLLRIFGTFVAMCAAYIVWYIVDGHTAGVLVFYFIFLLPGPYVIVKYPKYITIGMIGQVTLTLILGYELQVRKIGVTLSESNGQAYYPIYELAPYRLATVSAGLFVAWIWTIFPYPISEHSQLRKNLGSSLYLLANYYSVMHETVKIRIRGAEGDMDLKDSPGRRLDKARQSLFSKTTMLLEGLRAQSSFTKFDLPIGGRFPRETYEDIITHLQSVLNSMALVSYASSSFQDMHGHGEKDSESEWLRDFRKVIADAYMTSQEVTTLLSLLSASVASGQSLPPYLRTPEPYGLSKRMDALDRDILSVRHIAEPGYASFAVMQIGTKAITDDLKKLLAAVKELVGELDFSFHIVSTTDSSRNDSEDTLWTSEAQKGKKD